MDYTDLPSCALLRHGTVIVRMKMEVACSCNAKLAPVQDYPEAVHRLSKCEQCTRTRTNRKYSDCGSDIVDKCRPYRASAARSRYVNVCAAVCLLLLVSDLSPQSSAAPHRTMDSHRYKRVTRENSIWGNPCDLDGPHLVKELKYSREVAEGVWKQVSHAATYAEDQYKTFDFDQGSIKKFLSTWEGYPWMAQWLKNENNPDWFRTQVMQPNKVYGEKIDKKVLDDLMNNIDQNLPSMYTGLKVVVASLYMVSESLQDSDQDQDKEASHKNALVNITHQVRSVLCEFTVLMKSRNLEIAPLLDTDLPDYDERDTGSKIMNSILVYKDTIKYLDYLKEVFNEMKDRVS